MKRNTPTKNQFIALIDIDHFKHVNDTYGHLAGDNVLIQLASILMEKMSHNMMIARYGGEEFIIYLEADTLEEATVTLEHLRQHIGCTPFNLDATHRIPITVSIGLTKLKKDTLLKDAIHLADQRLYIAKEKGRDQLISISQ